MLTDPPPFICSYPTAYIHMLHCNLHSLLEPVYLQDNNI